MSEERGDFMLPWIIGGILVVVIAVWLMSLYNKFIALKNKSEEAFSTMDVYLKKRYDLIPNLVETVKGYAKHESSTLEKIVQARNMAVQARTPEEKIAQEKQVQGMLGNIFAIAESYPDLKANTNFIDLQKQLQRMEEEIANARKYYNGVVNTYNILCESFPSNIIANMFHFTKKPLYVVEQESHRENIKVSF